MKTRIAMISEHASPLANLGGVDSGGQNVYVGQIATNLARLGYQVDIFTRRDNNLMADIIDWKEGVRVIHVPAGPSEFVRKENLLDHMGAFTNYMIDFFKQQKQPYELIHANFWMSGLVAADIKVALGIPFVITFHALGKVRRQHQGASDEFPDRRFDIEQRLVIEADGIVSECPQDREDLVRFYDAAPAKIAQIPCGFDPEEFFPVDRAEARNQIGIPQDEWVVLQVGRMVPRKGVDTAIRGFAGLLREEDIAARMVIVGGESTEPDPVRTPEIGRLQKIAHEEGVQERVFFTGSRARTELKNYFSAADIFISTPWYEPFGLTPVEAMACATPVIGTRVGGIQYTVVDGQTGCLVPANDPQGVTRQLCELYHHPEKLQQLSEQAVRWVNEEFTWQKVSKMMAAFYEKVLTESRESAAQEIAQENRSLLDEPTLVWQGFDSAIEILQHSQGLLDKSIVEAAGMLIRCLERGGKVMVCGNGGSAADAQHFAAELVGRFGPQERKGLPVFALTSDNVFLTAWSNDMGYEKIFTRQVEAFGRPGDLLIGISTSGSSKNIVTAFQFARQMHIECLGLLGGNGGDLLPLSTAALVIPSENTQRIQEVQILVLHLICELVERHINAGTFFDADVLVDTLAPQEISLPQRSR